MSEDVMFTAELLGTVALRDDYMALKRRLGGELDPDSLAADRLAGLNRDIERLVEQIDLLDFY